MNPRQPTSGAGTWAYPLFGLGGDADDALFAEPIDSLPFDRSCIAFVQTYAPGTGGMLPELLNL